MTSQEMTPIPSSGEFDQLRAVADTLGRSGLFKDVKTFEVAVAKVMFGRDLGLGPTQAMTGIHIVDGKPELSANLQAALLRQYRSPEGARYDYRAEVSPQAARIMVFRVNADGSKEDVGETTFSLDDARAAGLANRSVWKSYPTNMLFARALSNAVAFFAPETTYGTRVYTDGEIGGELRGEPTDLVSEAEIVDEFDARPVPGEG